MKNKDIENGQKVEERKKTDREDHRQGDQERQKDRQEDGKEGLLDEISNSNYSPACIEFLHDLY